MLFLDFRDAALCHIKLYQLEKVIECDGILVFALLMFYPISLFPLFLSFGFLATEVVTVFVFQEPSLLSSLQDNGLTDVMLHALLIKDVSFHHCSCVLRFFGLVSDSTWQFNFNDYIFFIV